MNDSGTALPFSSESLQQAGVLVKQGVTYRQRGDSAAALACFLEATDAEPNHTAARIEAATTLRDLGRLDEAEAALRMVLSRAPGHVWALAQLGVTLRQKGDRVAALACFEKAVAADPTQVGARIQTATLLRDLGRLDEAEAALRTMLWDRPDHVWALTQLGVTLRQKGDKTAALACFQQASAAAPDLVDVRIDLAAMLRDLERPDEAEATLRTVLSQAHRHVGALVQLGVTLRQKGDKAGALACFEEAVDADADNFGARIEAAVTLRDLGHLGEAETALRTVLSRAPHLVWAMTQLGITLRQKGDKPAALTCFEKAVAADPNQIGARIQAATLLRDLGRSDEAEAALRTVLSQAPQNLWALTQLGVTLRQIGDKTGALACFEKAAAAGPSQVDARIEAAATLRDLGRPDEAEAALRTVLSQAPHHVGALLQLGYTLRIRGDHAGAHACFDKAVAAAPSHVDARVEAATALRDLGRLDESEAALRLIAAESPESMAAQQRLFRLLIDRHRLDDAEAVLHRMRRAWPDAYHVHAALGELARRNGDRESALSHFEAAVDAAPFMPSARFDVVAELADKGDFAEAERHIQAALDREPASLAALNWRAHLMHRQGDHAAAYRAYETSLSLSAGHTPTLLAMATQARALGRVEECKSLLDRALAGDPANLQALLQSAEWALISEDAETALALVRRARETAPAIPQPYVVEAKVLAYWSRFQEAQKLLNEGQQALGWRPEIAAMQIDLALRAGDLNRAHALVGTVDDDRARRHFGLGSQIRQWAIVTGRYDVVREALATVRPSTRAEQSHVAMLQGLLAEAQGQYELAWRHFSHAMLLNPLNNLHYKIAVMSILQLDFVAAGESIRKSLLFERTALRLRGAAERVSQSHLGHILNEFALDRDLLSQLKDIQADEPGRQIEALRPLVAANPDHTLTALCFLLALRRHGDLTDAPCQPGPPWSYGPIPKRISQYWDSAIPADVAEVMRSWQEANPDFEYRHFDDASARAFMRCCCAPAVLTAYERSREPAQRADIFRLAVLSVDGGFYADADDRCLHPIAEWAPPEASFVGFLEDYQTMANNFIGVAPHHPVVTRALEEATKAILRGDNELLWLSTGPGLITRAFAHVTANHACGGALVAKSVMFDMNTIRQHIAIHCSLSYKITDRHWFRSSLKNGSSRPRGLAVSGARGA